MKKKIKKYERKTRKRTSSNDCLQQRNLSSIFKLLQILTTIQVSTASNGRTFSNLKRIKTYLKNTMTDVRIIYYVKIKRF